MDLRIFLLVAMTTVLIIPQSEAGFRVRRRRRSCSPANCAVSGWSPTWSACSSPCGSIGTQYRTRIVTRQPSCGGAACPSLRQMRACNRGCRNGGSPVPHRCYCKGNYRGTCCEIADGGWSVWSPWGRCAKTCGTAYHYRTRMCNNPQPTNGGRPCTGETKERKLCSVVPCPVHGGWSPWGAWSTCSKSCGIGTQLRHRTCTNPSPAFGGKVCPPPSLGKRPCNGSSTCMFIKGIGCYEAKWSKVLKDFRSEMDWADFSPAVKKCAVLSKKKGYRFFAMHYYSKCVVDVAKRYDYASLQRGDCVDNVGMHDSMYVYIVR